MAKNRKSKSRRNKTRVPNVNANQRLRFDYVQTDLEDFLRSIEDRREYHPESDSRPARSFNKSRHRLVLPAANKNIIHRENFDVMQPAAVPIGIGFDEPDKVIVCVRRQRRKEVLHALNKTGKSGQKRPRRSEYSDVRC